MAKTMKPVQAVTIGAGWTGGIIARELTKAGMTVVGLERGNVRTTNPDFLVFGVHDEFAHTIRNKLFKIRRATRSASATTCAGAAHPAVRVVSTRRRSGRSGRALVRPHVALSRERVQAA